MYSQNIKSILNYYNLCFPISLNSKGTITTYKSSEKCPKYPLECDTLKAESIRT